MASRVSSIKGQLFSTSGIARVSSIRIAPRLIPPANVRVSAFKLTAYVKDELTPIRVSTLQAQAWASLDQGLYVPGDLFGSNEVWAPDLSITASYESPTPPQIEVNPFRADVPNVDQQRILREQHNLTQAGDSTFHWGVLTEVYATAVYTLGSLGKFFHDDLGMIHARFVKFSKFVPCAAKGFPVGFDLKSGAKWTVTNQLDRSSIDWIVGVALPYNEMAFAGDCFGWVVVDGFVPVELEVEPGVDQFLFGTEYGWAATGKVQVNQSGDSLGTRRTISKLLNLKPGEFWVEVKDLSLARLNGIISASEAQLVSRLDGIDNRLDALTIDLNSTKQNLSALTAQVGLLDSRVTAEVNNLSNALAAIRALMPDGDYKSYVDAQVNGLRAENQQQFLLVNQIANDAKIRADEAYALAQSQSNAALQAQIDALNDSMGGLTNRLIGFDTTIDTNTLLAGQVLVSVLDHTDVDGTDFYKFEPVNFSLANLIDVDITTTPPSDGDALCWDNTAGLWLPSASGGSGIPDAPSDGTTYGRKNGAWAAVGGGGGGTSWSNGCGERRFLVKATATGGFNGQPGTSLGTGSVNSFYWNANAVVKTLTFDFQVANIVDGFGVIQDQPSANSVWTIAGSHDDVTYTNIITNFTWGGTPYGPYGFTAGNMYILEFTNTVAYRYYKLTLNTGTTNNRYQQWFGFKCEPF